ncbi:MULTISPECIES: LysR substrate-binding domain-containing protein [unclassified Lysobacter]|uniref:LysR substrate-binding domain-containing protein n=1 Tax=unclassified Lysobacter TaxID=2635362 RepID=UPI001BEB34CE|nr:MULTISPECIES: LysR substrate-binding domain-containing protein [unclassified Lysobacter]MBT2745850.1 LysR family transcriptional regulator [Lysobacter sp. ISL-42]MBT2749591.1 LysR family transcriptional regulator [Lysobacter sp. ISL-50]MBT2778765.1 LysR family transcriptional regulator [Lysobacter sp. ISL-54]MBT2781360.1 LysR family transcriptional regulator [Lysobacter sp. ISL-52]
MTGSTLPPLSAIRAFEAAARLGSFTRAAHELDMTQAAVSYQIKRLEQRLGLVLFQRLARKVVLTRDGERLAPAVLDAFQGLRGAFAQSRERSQSELAITALPTLGANWLVPRLGGFQLAQPRLAVRLDTSVPLIDLAQGEFDLSLRNGGGQWPGMSAHFLLPGLFTPLCSPALIASGALRTPADLLGLARIGRERWWRQWLHAAGVAAGEAPLVSAIDLGVEQYEVTAALAGQGVAITSPLFFRAELASGRLVQPFELIVRDSRDYWLAYPEVRRGSAKICAFRDWVLAQARQDLEVWRAECERAGAPLPSLAEAAIA